MIEWKDGGFYASQKNGIKGNVLTSYYSIKQLIEDGAEVIGNIHDNPELLENI